MKKTDIYTIIIIRPSPYGEQLKAKIDSLGFNGLLMPAVKISKLNQSFRRCDYGICVSQIAVDLLDMQLGNVESVFAVGPKTATAIEKRFKRFAITPTQNQFNIKALLDLPELMAIRGKKINVFSGENTKPELIDTLRSRGADVVVCPVFKMDEPKWKHQKIPSTGLIYVTSAQMLHRFDAYYIEGQKLSCLKNYDIVVGSSDAYSAAEELQFKGRLIQLENPLEETFIQYLNTM